MMDDRMVRILVDAQMSASGVEFCYRHAGEIEQPDFPRAAWRAKVANEDTIAGYWTWVGHELAIEFKAFMESMPGPDRDAWVAADLG